MAARGNSAVKQQRTSLNFRRALAAAFLEWLLILFLIIDAIFSYLITRFAWYCELQTPCLLCSRLDHILGNKKLKCYWDLFCGNHKLEISSLVFCHAHNKLVDVHGMCENCLFSFATVNKSNTETYRLLVGKLGEGSCLGYDEEPLPHGHHNDNQSSIRHCSCCNEPWIPRGYAQKLIQTKSFGSQTSELDLPVSYAGEHSLHYSKKRNEKRSVPIRATHMESSRPDPLSHVGYSELKITSDTESEVLLSDDDDADAVIHETSGPKDDFAHKCVQMEPHVFTLPHESVLEKLVDPAIAPEALISVSQLQSDITLPDNDRSIESTTAVRHGLEELNWELIDFKADPSALAELISLNDVPPSSYAGKTSIDVSKDSELINHIVPPPSNSRESLVDATKQTKLISLNEVSPSSNAGTPTNVSEESGLNYHDVLPSSNSRESLVDATKESKLIFDQVHFSSDAESPVDVSEESKRISANVVPLSAKGRDTPPEVSEDSKVILPDYVPPMSNAAQSPIDVSEESKLISISKISPTGKDTTSEVSKDSKVILLDDVPPMSNATESAVNVSVESKIISVDDAPSQSNGRDTPAVSNDSKVILPDDVPPLSNDTESPIEAPKESCISSDENEQTSNCKTGSEPNTSDETVMERNPLSSDTGLQASNLLDLSDAYKVAVGNRGRQLSGLLAEQWNGKDSSRLSEDLKLLLSQLSATRGFEQVLSDVSPKVSLNSDDSSSNGMQLLQKRISLERNESGFESLDGSTVSEIEGESVVDRLKRQVEHDKKLLSALYRELEEERNASAVAVNQSMAMITRLQEEKASLHMEALQNLRMMEEQAEYDMEALQKTNELLAEKEKEIQDLEEEVQFYQKKFPNAYMMGNILEPTQDCKEREIKMDHSEDTCGEDRAGSVTNSVIKNLKTDTPSEDIHTAAVKNSLLDFEDERSYILRSLKKLEKKLYMFSYNGLCSDLHNGEYSGNGVNISDSEDINCKVDPQANSRTEGSDLSTLNDDSASRGSPHAHGHVSSHKKPQLSTEENTELNCSEQTSLLCGGTNLTSLGDEVADLNERLEALEADQNFLELTIKSLKNGEEGTRFIQEIASHLRELRRIGLRRDDTFA